MPSNHERSQRVAISLSAEEVAAVDNFRFDRRMPNRTSALRALLLRGLEVSEKTETGDAFDGGWRGRV